MLSTSSRDLDATQTPPAAGAAPSLNAVGAKYGTDKARGGHDYLGFYERFLRELRHAPVTVLEIGVLRGQSVKMWSDYFQAGRVIGVDINPDTQQYESDRIKIEIADQSNVAHLIELGRRYGPFDLIVDDGSHLWNHQITTLQYLYPFVVPGGYFIVEDIDTSFGGYQPAYRGNSPVTAVAYLQKMADYLVAGEQLDIAAEPDPFLRTYARATEFIAFHRRTAVLRRHALEAVAVGATWAPTSLWSHAPALIAESNDGERPPPASLTVHLGYRGDATNHLSLIGGAPGDSGHKIQGFVVNLPGEASADLQYRALQNDGQWTDWVSAGAFVGTRGKALALRGFAVRLRGELGRRFQCRYAGGFSADPTICTASDGADCRGAEGGELEAMHIVLEPRGD